MALPSKETVQRACDYLAAKYRSTGGVFVQDIYDSQKVIGVNENANKIRTVAFSLFTTHELRNTVNMVHGGASSTIISLFSSLALAVDSRYWKGSEPTDEELEFFSNDLGTTRSIDVQLIQAVPLDAEIIVQCHVASNTKSNAYVITEIYNQSGRLLVSGTHDIMKRHPGALDDSAELILHSSFRHARL